MNIFTSIDDKLNEFAKKHNAEIHTREIGFDGEPRDETELRKIIWIEGILAKGILIRPDPFSENMGSMLWEFENYAVVEDGKSYPDGVPFWRKYLLEGVQFQEIEEKIDHLLTESEKNLAVVRMEDMRLEWTNYNT